MNWRRGGGVAYAEVYDAVCPEVEGERILLAVDLHGGRVQLQCVEAVGRYRLVIDQRVATLLDLFAGANLNVHVHGAVGRQLVHVDGVAEFAIQTAGRADREMEFSTTI